MIQLVILPQQAVEVRAGSSHLLLSLLGLAGLQAGREQPCKQV
jgi:hypothetical protein